MRLFALKREEYYGALKKQWRCVMKKFPRWHFIRNCCENINHYHLENTTPVGNLFRKSYLDRNMRAYLREPLG